MSKPEKMVIVADRLTGDLLFGKVNGMVTVWLHEFKDVTPETFKLWCPNCFKLE